MIAFRGRMTRGETRTGLIESRHSFSFGRYDDPQHRQFRVLRVLNEDRLIPGTGIRHAERNPDAVAATRLLQVWVIPARQGLAPGYAQRAYPERQGRLRLIAAPAGPQQAAAGARTLEQDVRVYAARR